MAKIYVKKNESLEDAIRRFKKKVVNEGIMTELKRREYYMSPSQKRKEKSKQAQKKLRKYQSKHPTIEENIY